jgi:hypothetical protein
MPAAKKVTRSAKSGEFVAAKEAKDKPDETVTETVKRVVKKAAPKKTSEDLEREAEFARKCRVYEVAVRQGTPLDYPYGDPQDPQWAEVRQAVQDKLAEDEAAAEKETQRVNEVNAAANAEAVEKRAAARK